MAEVELQSQDETIEKPAWAGIEVSGLERYYNMRLGQHPWSEWTEAERMAKDANEYF